MFGTDAGKQPERFWKEKNPQLVLVVKSVHLILRPGLCQLWLAAPITVGQLLAREWHSFHWQSEGTDHSFLQQ